MNENSINKSYNLIWKNIIIKKNISYEYANKCIELFYQDDKRLYLYKEECNTEPNESNESNEYNEPNEPNESNETNESNEMKNDNIKKGLNFIDKVLKIHNL